VRDVSRRERFGPWWKPLAVGVGVVVAGALVATGAVRQWGGPADYTGGRDKTSYDLGFTCGQSAAQVAANDLQALADPAASLDALLSACRRVARDAGVSSAPSSPFRKGLVDGFAEGPSEQR
jgi:hypothetical protein